MTQLAQKSTFALPREPQSRSVGLFDSFIFPDDHDPKRHRVYHILKNLSGFPDFFFGFFTFGYIDIGTSVADKVAFPVKYGYSAGH